MLNAVQDEAASLGWAVVSESASPSFLRRISREQQIARFCGLSLATAGSGLSD